MVVVMVVLVVVVKVVGIARGSADRAGDPVLVLVVDGRRDRMQK